MNFVTPFAAALALGAVALLGPLSTACAADDPTNASAPTGDVVHLKRFDSATENPGRYLFFQNGIPLKDDAVYTLTFWAKASQTLRIRVTTKFDQPPWTGFGSPTVVELSTEWQKFEVEIKGEKSLADHTRLQFNCVESDVGDLWIANVQLKESGASAYAADLITNGNFEAQLGNWHVEGLRKDAFEADIVSLSNANAPPKN